MNPRRIIRGFFTSFLLEIGFLCNPLFSYEHHNIFLGMGIGSDFLLQQSNLSRGSFGWQIFGGYEYKPLRVVGVMGYLESLMVFRPDGIETQVRTQISLNADVSLEVLKMSQDSRMGPYIGVGIGYIEYQNTIVGDSFSSKVALLVNGGWQITIDESNILKLGVKSLLMFNEEQIAPDRLQFMLSYAYRF